MFQNALTPMPAIILSLMEKFKQDPRAHKVNLVSACTTMRRASSRRCGRSPQRKRS
ncbi:hypothetical protein M8494_29220 [Serratia ureilytica]